VGESKEEPAMLKSAVPLNQSSKPGFTIIEVMLVLGITGLMLVGIIGGTYSSIATQRYNDSVRSFSEFLRQLYAEVISPQSLGEGNSDQDAVYGKVAVFGINETGDDTVYTATLVGQTNPPRNESGFLSELATVEAKLFCGSEDRPSTVTDYIPMWEAEIANTKNTPLKGTLIIARSPASGTVHTAFSKDVAPNLKDNCRPDDSRASEEFNKSLIDNGGNYSIENDVDFCIVSDNSRIVRDIRLAADGHNSSAINLIPADGDVKCQQK